MSGPNRPSYRDPEVAAGGLPSGPQTFAGGAVWLAADAPCGDRAPSAGVRPRRNALRAAALVAAILVAQLLGGFLYFADMVADLEPAGLERADGIVVLTGGRERIRGAIDLLRAQRGRRLLITGVHKTTRAGDLARIEDNAADLLACCVDLGFAAETTIGNAAETAAWVKEHRFGSLIVVTGAYHMPRSLAEFAAAMPGIELVPYPVRPADLELDHWYRRPDTARLLLSEYAKFLLSRLRLALDLG